MADDDRIARRPRASGAIRAAACDSSAPGFRKTTSFDTVSALWSRRDTRPMPAGDVAVVELLDAHVGEARHDAVDRVQRPVGRRRHERHPVSRLHVQGRREARAEHDAVAAVARAGTCPDTISSGASVAAASGSGSTPTPRNGTGLRAGGRETDEVDPRQDGRDVADPPRERARPLRVGKSELERRLLRLADGAAVHDLQVADALDRALLEPLERLRDEAAGQGEGGEAEGHDRDHQDAAPLLAHEVAPGQGEGAHAAASERHGAVVERDDAARARHDEGVVRGEEKRDSARGVDPLHQVQDLLRRVAVEVRRRLVGEDDRRAVGESAGDRDALPLSAREQVRPDAELVGEADRREQLARPGAPRPPRISRRAPSDTRRSPRPSAPGSG